MSDANTYDRTVALPIKPPKPTPERASNPPKSYGDFLATKAGKSKRNHIGKRP